MLILCARLLLACLYVCIYLSQCRHLWAHVSSVCSVRCMCVSLQFPSWSSSFPESNGPLDRWHKSAERVYMRLNNASGRGKLLVLRDAEVAHRKRTADRKGRRQYAFIFSLTCGIFLGNLEKKKKNAALGVWLSCELCLPTINLCLQWDKLLYNYPSCVYLLQ